MTTGRYPVTDYLPGELQTLRSISQGSDRDAVCRPCRTLCSVYLDGAACVALACDAATPRTRYGMSPSRRSTTRLAIVKSSPLAAL